MNEINVRNEILGSIDNVNDVTMESTLDVMGSLALAYDKAAMITEYSNAEDLSMFSIFQEAEVAEAKKEPGLGMKILMFIPNILKKIWEFLKQAWNGEIVPTAKKAAKEAESLSDKFKGLFNKIIGKDESWIREHAKELGISGAMLALVLGVATWFNKDNLKKLFTEFIQGISGFFKKTSDNFKQYGVIFEMVVWNKFKTNISFKGLKDAITSLPKFFKDCAAYHERYIKGGLPGSTNGEIKQIDYNRTDISAMETELNALNTTFDQMTNADIVVADTVEYTIPQVIDGITADLDPDSEEGKELIATMEKTANVMKLTDEQINAFSQNFPAKSNIQKILSKFAGWFQKVGGMIAGWFRSLKNICTDFIQKVKDAKAVDNQLKDDDKVPEEGDEEIAANEEDAADAKADDISDTLVDNLDNPPKRPSSGSSIQDEDNFEPAVMDQHVDDVPEGEATVQESAVEETDAEAEAINNHWYR